MIQTRIWARFSFCFILFQTATWADDGVEVRNALLNFIGKLSENSSLPSDPKFGWNPNTFPCNSSWQGVVCDIRNTSVKKIFLDGFNFSGVFDPTTLCDLQSLASSLTIISLNDNRIRGENFDRIANCKQLIRLHIRGNQFSGSLPGSLARLNNLKRLDISQNNFSVVLPDLARISGLTEFLAEKNQLSGEIPEFEFSNFATFNVSFNNFSGVIPSGASRLPASSFIGNPLLCGKPLPDQCQALPSASPPENDKPKKKYSKNEILMFSGYFLLGLSLFLVILWFCRKGKKKEAKLEVRNKVASVEDGMAKTSSTSVEFISGVSKSEYSAASGDSAAASQSLVLLTSPEVNGLKFENLLKAPAELLGKGKHGSTYKVMCEDQGTVLTVKRIKEWPISGTEFKWRMRRLDQARHPNVLPAIAFYSSKQEKLLVYEYQQNGSLSGLLLGAKMGKAFEWSSRLFIAAGIADALAFMHQELFEDGIGHGNLKSSNILLNKNMEPFISEYGLMVDQNEEQQPLPNNTISSPAPSENQANIFSRDIYALGVILLELLTGKMVQNSGLDLASWVVSVIREEWTGEVFDRNLIQEGASEERMVNLLQIAVKCVNRSPQSRPSINQVAMMISTLREEEERSMDFSERSAMTRSFT